jgi:uncharacterized membrane protein HdeD (DUF308 family)
MKNMQDMMFQRSWWAMILLGVVAIVFGLLALAYTVFVVFVAILLIGIFVLLWGVTYIMVGVTAKAEMKKAWPFYLMGILGVVVGFLMIVSPSFGFQLVMILLGIWAIIVGFLYGVIAFSVKDDKAGRALMLVAGILAIVLGVLFILLPNDSAQVIMWLVGVFAIVMGAIAIGMGIYYRPKQSRAAG